MARNFWVLFGGIWFVVGASWLVAGLVAYALAADEEPARLAAFAGGGAVLATAGGVIAGKGLRDARTRRRLAESGVTAEGTVTAVRRTRVRINGHWQWQVHYRYADYRGERHEGRSGYLSHDEANAWAPGDAAPIRYDEARPRTSVWLGTAPGLPPPALEP